MVGISKSYEQGFEDGQKDYRENMMPKPLRGFSVDYRNGYSDGYFSLSKDAKVY